MKNNVLYYSIGALLYCPANRISLADSVINEKFGHKYSLALCLEDTINDNFVEEAEKQLLLTLAKIYHQIQISNFYLPKIFIRVRNPEQIERLTVSLGESINIVTGYIIPKFSMDNADNYINALIKANEIVDKKLYMMPIYESSSIIDLRYRVDILYALKEKLSAVEELVLNIRVGGNDLCHIFGFRRGVNQSIHSIRPVASILNDIVTVYSQDYIVSGPVYEYYAGTDWIGGLSNEILEDQMAGFVGKTVIHPNQIEVVNKNYMVSDSDYNDAKSILNWNLNSNDYVAGNLTRERMDEYKTHNNWAQRILFLAESYGIRTKIE